MDSTWHGVRVITKLYFAIFAAFNESVTLNLAQSEVIQGHRFWYQSKAESIFLLVINSNLDPVLHRFRDTAA